MNFEVLYSAAHAEFSDTEPLGGGKAVADYLIREWRKSEPFELTVLSPSSLVCLELPKQLAELSERQYARFCRQFEYATTDKILKRDPQRCVVLSNDISEGPDFGTLGKRGYKIVTIFHVDVVEYFTRFYVSSLIRPETTARFRWFRLMPDVLRLVFEKQYECVRYSARIVVPSAPMREVILRCYPWCPPENIVVLPWGNVAEQDSARAAATRYQVDVADDEIVIMTLSRLSPEKGIERLLAALPRVDAHARKLRVFICGAPAYMKGRAYERKLRRLAAKVRTAEVEFTGHVIGGKKAVLLQRADIFVSPSKHESYGLTIAEALAAGCRVISHHHYGAEGTVVDCSRPKALAAAISAMIADGRTKKTGDAARRSPAAERLAALLVATMECPVPPARR
ncbi:MAG: glycosyltransferase family 4 protein [Verrucomicrobiia bacterium]|jgi:glycosyltransferase involved in cell wall biosynthesis